MTPAQLVMLLKQVHFHQDAQGRDTGLHSLIEGWSQY